LRGGIVELKQAANHRRPLTVSTKSKSCGSSTRISRSKYPDTFI
jgi:hypothetical protein